MDLKIFNTSLDFAGVLDNYRRLYYTVSFTEAGRLELTTSDNEKTRALLAVGSSVLIGSRRYYIDKTEISDGVINVYGRDSLYLFARRAYRIRIRNTTNAGELLCTLAGSGESVIPGTLCVSGNPVGTSRYFDHDYNSLYRLMCDICVQNGCGMRLEFNPSTKSFMFCALPVIDRSASQSILPRVIISRERENVLSERTIEDTSDYYNAAVVYGCENLNGGRYSVTVGNPESDRRELFVDASDVQISRYASTENDVVTYNEYAYLAKLTSIGQNALDSHTARRSFEAELMPDAELECGTIITFMSDGVCYEALICEVAVEIKDGHTVNTVKISGDM